jgi:hypothetical protein
MLKIVSRQLTTIVATIAFSAILVPVSYAGCANPSADGAYVSPQSWTRQDSFAPDLHLVGDRHDDEVSMVGMWHVTFTAKGNTAPGTPPDGVSVDNALAQWHIDGTEVTTSSRNPATGSLCLGVWERVGRRHYKLNHFGISWDPSTDPNHPQGFANIRQNIVLDPDGKTFKGIFIIDQYDQSGNILIEIKGLLNGTRINIHTSVGDLLSQS